MKITLLQDDLDIAIQQYLTSQGLQTSNKNISIKMSGRSDVGFQAEIEITKKAGAEPTPTAFNIRGSVVDCNRPITANYGEIDATVSATSDILIKPQGELTSLRSLGEIDESIVNQADKSEGGSSLFTEDGED